MRGVEFVLPQIILVPQIGVGMDVSGVAAKNVHGLAVNNSTMMVPRSRWSTGGRGATPRLLLDVKPQQIIEHSFAIVTPKDINGIVECDCGVFRSGCPDEFVAFGHSPPSIDNFKRAKIKSQTIGGTLRRRIGGGIVSERGAGSFFHFIFQEERS